MEKDFSYYAVIPAKILLDMDLSSQAKLHYGVISALCGKLGYCWATNKYLGDIFGQSERSVQRYLSELKDRKHITIEIDMMAGSERKIYLAVAKKE